MEVNVGQYSRMVTRCKMFGITGGVTEKVSSPGVGRPGFTATVPKPTQVDW